MYDMKRRPSSPGVPEQLTVSARNHLDYTSLSSDDQEKLRNTLRSQNGMVVEYNPFTSTLLGCNTNVIISGSDAQAKAALNYLILIFHETSNRTRAFVILTLSLSRRDIQLRPSVAENSGTVQRIISIKS